MIVSPFTPLFFINRKSDGIDSEYTQTFSVTDRILLQVLCENAEMQPKAKIINFETREELTAINFKRLAVNDETILYYSELTFSPGVYSVSIKDYGESEIFRVTDSAEELKDTVLIQYSMRNNRQRKDALFFIEGLQYFFQFRVPGGFKDSNWSFGVESEQFVTPLSDISQLYGLESTIKSFTLGNGIGVPVWFGEMLNRILSCSYVYLDGERYCRKDSSVPELTVQLEGVNSFVFTQLLQQVRHLQPRIEDIETRMILRAVGVEKIRANANSLYSYRKI